MAARTIPLPAGMRRGLFGNTFTFSRDYKNSHRVTVARWCLQEKRRIIQSSLWRHYYQRSSCRFGDALFLGC